MGTEINKSIELENAWLDDVFMPEQWGEISYRLKAELGFGMDPAGVRDMTMHHLGVGS